MAPPKRRRLTQPQGCKRIVGQEEGQLGKNKMAGSDAYRRFLEGETFREAQAMILKAAPKICDDMCGLVGNEKLSKREKLDGVFNLLKFAGTGRWRPQSEGAHLALPKIAAFLSSMASDDITPLRARLRATAYLLQGTELALWAIPAADRDKVARYIGKLFQVKL